MNGGTGHWRGLACCSLANAGEQDFELEGRMQMLFDALVAFIVTAIAVVLGLTVHPVLFFIVALAVVYLVARGRAHRGVRSRTY